ncbi:uncharacterized protein CANTADRAFT_27473, partial [Suhomyces tanzawaensis NRRL Y-17324]
MNFQIYFASDLIRQLARPQQGYYVVGYKIAKVYVAVQLTTEPIAPPPHLSSLTIIGSLGLPQVGDLQFGYDPTLKVPYIDVHDDCTYSIILFEPPNFNNLEYLSVRPILLQSMGKESTPNEQDKYTAKLEIFEPSTEHVEHNSVASSEIMDKINLVLKTRIDLQASQKKHQAPKSGSIHPLVRIIVQLVTFLQRIIIWLIWTLNYKVYGYSLVSVSNVVRQLDLRLKQINYFPIQFLCYYDKSILYNEDSPLLKNLKLPIFNSDLNINNSNYINLHNSAWLMFNDILMGVLVHDLIIQNFDTVTTFLHKTFIQRILYSEISTLIHWIATHHPAGFKLND